MVSKTALTEQYDNINALLDNLDESKTFKGSREFIIERCIEHDIELFNLCALPTFIGRDLLSRFIIIISSLLLAQKNAHKNEVAMWTSHLKKWHAEFKMELQRAPNDRENHASAFLSVGDQQERSGKVTSDTLLALNDMFYLFNDDSFMSPDILKSDPFELPNFSAEESDLSSAFLKDEGAAARLLSEGMGELVKELTQGTEKSIRELINQEKDIYLPIAHQGHWVSLVREQGVWTLFDPQPYNDRIARQNFIRINCSILLTKYDDNFKELEYTNGKQTAFYDCGTHVVNHWRKTVNNDYVALSHEEMLREVGAKQGVEIVIVPPPPVPSAASSTATRRQASFRLSEDGSFYEKEKGKRNEKEKERVYDSAFWEENGFSRPHTLGGSDLLGSFEPLDQPDLLGTTADSQEPISFSLRYQRRDKARNQRLSAEPAALVPGDDRSSNSSVPVDSYETEDYEPVPEKTKQINNQILKIEQVLKTLKEKETEYRNFRQSAKREDFDTDKEFNEYIEKYEDAESHAKELHEGVHKALVAFKQSSKDLNDYNDFRYDTDVLIKTHKSSLSTHRDQSNIVLCNVLLGLVLGLGVIYGLIIGATLLTSKRTPYLWRTDGLRKVYDLEDVVEEMESLCQPG